MSNEDDILDVVRQLSLLQLKQNILFKRLEKATQGEVDETPRPVTPVTPPPFEIGQAVRIRNPGVLQPKTGHITRIGKGRITVTSDSGIRIARSPKNLTLLHHDH
jgi:hypothetical protein